RIRKPGRPTSEGPWRLEATRRSLRRWRKPMARARPSWRMPSRTVRKRKRRQKDSAPGLRIAAPATGNSNAGRVGHRRPARHISGGMAQIRFRKMHGLGNDFVVLDRRRDAVAIDAETARNIADRRTGIGCDQLILIEPPRHPTAQVSMRILNADGSEAEACGNATRCIARLLAEETGDNRTRIETVAGLLDTEVLPDLTVAVDMGPARTGWRDIPLAREMDTNRVDLTLGPLREPVCTNIGNPHATFFVADAEAVDLAALGPRLEHDKLFPERANIGVAAVQGRGRKQLVMFEARDRKS